MLEAFPDSIIRLIDRFSNFPGIGKKTAQRMAFHVLKDSNENLKKLLRDLIKELRSQKATEDDLQNRLHHIHENIEVSDESIPIQSDINGKLSLALNLGTQSHVS